MSAAAARPAVYAQAAAPRVLTALEAAAEMRCNEKTVRRMIGRGEVRARLVAGRWLIRPEDLPTRLPPRKPPPPRPRKVHGEGVAAQAVRELEESLS